MRCEFGFYGSPLSVGGSCSPCLCHPSGSLDPDECDSGTGQCVCAPGVVGRDCSRCPVELHVVSSSTGGGRGCRDCREPCVESLLAEVRSQGDLLATSNSSALDPNPGRTLTAYARKNAEAEERLRRVAKRKETMEAMAESLEMLKAQADLAGLEVDKSGKAARLLAEGDETMRTKAEGMKRVVGEMTQEVDWIIRHLREYAQDESAELLRVKPALSEARVLLEAIGNVSHAEADIAARRELSHSRQTLWMVKEMLFGYGEASKLRERLLESEKKLNDLLQYVDTALANVREVCTDRLQMI